MSLGLKGLMIMTPFFFTEQSAPQFVFYSKSPVIEVTGGVVRLRCEVSGSPPPKVTWTKDNKLLQSTNRIKLLKVRQVVKIKEAAIGDSGTYRCTARNALGEINGTIVLKVTTGVATLF